MRFPSKTMAFIAITVLAATRTLAQQDPNRIFYRYNMNLVNPAYAGEAEGVGLTLDLRSQWARIEGAPETQSLIFDTPVGANVGLGVSVVNDRTFIEKRTSLAVDFSYRVALDKDTHLFLGIKAGANSYNVNTQGLRTFDVSADPSLNGIDGGFSPNVGSGAYLRGKKYFVALSAPGLLTPKRLRLDNGNARLGTGRVHTYLAAGYDLKVGRKLTLRPAAMARYVSAAPLSLDITATLLFSERFEIGAAYRINEAFGAMAKFNISDKLAIGYAYETPFDQVISGTASGTHEILVKMNL